MPRVHTGRKEESLRNSLLNVWLRAAIFLTIQYLQRTTNHHGRAEHR